MDSLTKILVTGASGFMGSHICDQLLKEGYAEVYAIDDLSGTGNSNENLTNFMSKSSTTSLPSFTKIDISKTKSTYKLIEYLKPDIIFHLAANAREGASFFQPLNITRRNYLAYMNILEPAIKNNIDKMIMFSSMAVYGNQTPPFSEDMERQPVDIYGINKASMEHSTEILSEIHDFRYTIIRPHNVFGLHQSLRDPYRNVIAIFMNRIMRNEPIYIYGDGYQKRAFSYIDNSINCYIECMNQKSDGNIINIGGKEPITINKLSNLVFESMNKDITSYPIINLPDRPHEVRYAYSTYEKSEKLLNYNEKIGMKEGINRMAEWALTKGAQDWSDEKLTLWNSKAPIIWK